MPIVRITYAGEALAPERNSHLHDEVTNLMSSVLAKKAQLASVLVEQVAIIGRSAALNRLLRSTWMRRSPPARIPQRRKRASSTAP